MQLIWWKAGCNRPDSQRSFMIADCKFRKIGECHGGLILILCDACGKQRCVKKRVKYKSNCKLSQLPRCLAGTQLALLLRSLGFSHTKTCGCRSKASRMDLNGCDWCEENIDTIVGWLAEEAANRGLPFLSGVGRLLVKRAIHNARKATPH